MTHRSRNPTSVQPQIEHHHRGESGSAYLVALLALVVLTIIGLSLTLVTQTEMQVGSVERTVKRVFYAADAGISEATARALTDADYKAHTFETSEPDANPLLNQRESVDVSPFYPILDAPCNLCEINNLGLYSTNAYRAINHAVSGTATRLATTNNDPFGRKTLSTMVEVQPWQSTPEAYLVIDSPDELAKIKF